jgi:UDP-N-acetylglucosamine 4,6-dehydratase
MMERIFQNAPDTTKFTLVRYGNVLASRGSVIPLWRKQAALGEPLTITDLDMTRFWMTPETAVDCIMTALSLPHGSIYVPKMKSINIRFMAQLIAPNCELTEIGLRSMERLHEFLVSPDEMATEFDDHFIISNEGTMHHEYTSYSAERLTSQEFRAMLQ